MKLRKKIAAVLPGLAVPAGAASRVLAAGVEEPNGNDNQSGGPDTANDGAH